MELLQLKYFCDSARSENFSKTAAKFGVPPAGISQSIKRLESELGVKLFERRANRISLSEEGRAFYEKASSALNLIEDGKNTVKESLGGGQIKILAAAVRRIVMQTVEKFRRAYPNVDILLSCSPGESPEDFDVVISSEEISSSLNDRCELMSEGLVIALNNAHPLAKKKTLVGEDIKDESFVFMGKSSNLSHTCERICAELGFSPKISIRCDDPYYVRKCVELSLGIAIVPKVSWHGLFSNGVELRPFCEQRRTVYAYLNKRRAGGKCASVFVKMLKNECADESMKIE